MAAVYFLLAVCIYRGVAGVLAFGNILPHRTASSLAIHRLPPAAVADYLKRIWDSNSSVSTVMGGNGGEKDGILGVTSNNPNMPMYNGLEHYLFRHNGVVYSWGEQFNDIAHAAREGAGGANWQVCRFIEVH